MVKVMYHYVRPTKEEYPYFNSLDIEKFKRQLDFFQSKFGFIEKNDYIEAIKSKKNIKGVVLTFDDGLKDHIQFVLPELIKRKLWGIFYISTGVYQSKKLLGVHRVHYLKGKFGPNIILNDINSLLEEFMLDNSLIKEFDKEIYLSSSYDRSEKKLRRLLNYMIKYEFRDSILDNLMNKYFDEECLHREVYLTESEIKTLSEYGNIIGSHTVSHKVLSRLTYYEQEKEIQESFNFIKNISPQDFLSFCYPYGYKSSFNEDSIKILKKQNIDEACVFDNQIQGDILNNLMLSRVDCNKF